MDWTLALQKCPGAEGWTLHGLWPNGSDACDPDARFHAAAVADLQPRLDVAWPSCRHGSDSEGFWRHEWLKHGFRDPFLSAPLYFMELSRNCTRILSDA